MTSKQKTTNPTVNRVGYSEKIISKQNYSTIPFFNSDGKPVAFLNTATKVLTKTAIASRHFLQRPPAICFDEDIISGAIREGCQLLAVKDKETGKKYISTIDNFQENCFRINRRFGIQLALILKFWNISGGPVEEPKQKTAPRQEPPRVRQAELFLG